VVLEVQGGRTVFVFVPAPSSLLDVLIKHVLSDISSRTKVFGLRSITVMTAPASRSLALLEVRLLRSPCASCTLLSVLLLDCAA